jgi:transposase InsO family protein
MASAAEVKAMVASATAHRGHVTRAETELHRIGQFVQDHPSSRGLHQLELALEKFQRHVAKVEEIYMELQEADKDDDRMAAYAKRLDENADLSTSVLADTLAIIDTAGKNPAPALAAGPVPAAAGAWGGARPKVCEALKPFRLKIDHNPAELRSWLNKFKAYYSTSQLHQFSVAEQHSFLFNITSVDLETRIREHDEYDIDLPVFGDAGSIISILTGEFLYRYPLFNRRLEYHRLEQVAGQEFSNFGIRLRQKGDEADLHNMGVDEMYVFRYLTGVTDAKLRDRFLKLDNPCLEDLKREVRAYEVGRQAAKAMDTTAKAAKVEDRRSKSQSGTKKKWFKAPKELLGKCFRCGEPDHVVTKCPRPKEDFFCEGCRQKGHAQSVCMKPYRDQERSQVSMAQSRGPSRAQSRAPSPENWRSRPSPDTSDSEAEDRTSAVTCQVQGCTLRKVSQPTPKLYVDFSPKAHPDLEFGFQTTPDTGATRSVIAKDLMVRMGVPVKATSARLFAANGQRMSCEGTVEMRASCFGVTHVVNALVSSAITNEILLSWHDLQALGVLSYDFPNMIKKVATGRDNVDKIKEEYKDVLCDKLGMGTVMKGDPMKIHMRQDILIKPKRKLTSRQVPLHMQAQADEVVNELLAKGVLQKVNTPTEWISLGHFVPKEGGRAGLRLVTDYIDVNEYVLRPVHPFPSSQDIIQSIKGGSKWFAKLDAVQGYFQIPLEEESSFLTTFLLPSGRYRYTRAPMGLSASGDEWCQRSDLALQGLEGCKKLVDDILVQAPTEEILHSRLRAVLDRCRQHGISISNRKLQIGQEVKFAGYIVSADGVYPDPEKLEAIRSFKVPNDLTSLRSFLGLANQLGHFLPDLAHATRKMRTLLKKGIAYVWLPDHEKEFAAAKDLIMSSAVVKYFDPGFETALLTDASRLNGLGYALVQTGQDGRFRLIKCGSCALTPTQSRYATIELECLAVEYAVRKCQFYLKGMNKPFKVITDHKPLVGIFGKLLHEVENPRLQRMRGKLDGAGYVFNVEWQAGKDHQIADALSRAPVFDPEDDGDGDVHVKVVADANLSPLLAAATDPEYVAIVDAIKNGKELNDLPSAHPATAYKGIWSELSLMDDQQPTLVVFNSSRILVPKRARQELLRLLHLPHAGIVKTRVAAKQLYYWPGMTNEIKMMVESCSTCREALPSQALETMLEPAVSSPMSAVGVDLCDVAGKTWLVMVDRYSGFPFAHRLKSLTSASVIKQLMRWFCDWGFPSSIRSDGGPQFRSEFAEFCSKYKIAHELSSPYNPRSNGLAESAVKNVKKILKKCLVTGEDHMIALAEFRSLPRADGFSPAQMLFGRRLRGLLPTLPSALLPISQDEAVQARRRVAIEAKAAVDAHAHDLPGLNVGQEVLVQHPITTKWDAEGKIVAVRDRGRSYMVSVDGKEYIRNRRFLRPILIHAGGADQAMRDQERGDLDVRSRDPSGAVEQAEKKKSLLRRSPRLEAKKRVRFCI